MEATDSPKGYQRGIVHTVFLVISFILLISGLPTFFPAQESLRNTLDDAIDGVGLWQGQWQLFAPVPDKTNCTLFAHIDFQDGSSKEWHSPDPKTFSILEKIRYFRWMEYVDGISDEDNRIAWESLANFIATTAIVSPETNAKPIRVALWQSFVEIPTPSGPIRSINNPYPLNQKNQFYVKEFLIK